MLAASITSARVVGISVVNPSAAVGLPGQVARLLADLPEDVAVVLGGPAAASIRDVVAAPRLRAVDSLAAFRSVLGELRPR